MGKDYFRGNAYGKVLILSVSDTQEDILKKILKVVESSVDVDDRTLPSEKIELADLQILLPEKKGLSERAGNCA